MNSLLVITHGMVKWELSRWDLRISRKPLDNVFSLIGCISHVTCTHVRRIRGRYLSASRGVMAEGRVGLPIFVWHILAWVCIL